MQFCLCFARDANGTLWMVRAFVLVPQPTVDSESGFKQVSFRRFGSRDFSTAKDLINWIGHGWRWTVPCRRLRWAGKKTGPNPTDRGKDGTKRSVLTEAHGIPVSVAVDGANRHDMKMVRDTFENIQVERPKPTKKEPQGICQDKGYDYDDVRELDHEFGFTAHIQSRGEEAKAIKKKAGFKARRWVVERTHSWMNRFRRILVRWEKRADTYIAMLHFTCGLITWRATGLLK